MKNIELTEEHKSKLLEMCKKLFPEYICWKFGKMKINGDKELWFYDKYDNNYKIYWFEFCMTHLVEKILNPNPNNPNRGLQDRFKNFFWETNLYAMKFDKTSKHPVNYLYEEFKKLK